MLGEPQFEIRDEIKGVEVLSDSNVLSDDPNYLVIGRRPYSVNGNIRDSNPSVGGSIPPKVTKFDFLKQKCIFI